MSWLWQTPFLTALGSALIVSFWQGALLWLAYKAVLAALPAASARFRFMSAMTTLLAATFCFMATLLYSWLFQPAGAISFLNALIPGSTYSFILNGFPLFALLYLAFFSWLIIRYATAYRFSRTLRISGLVKADARYRLFASHWAQQFGIKRPVKIWLSKLVDSPVTVGHFKPMILLPLACMAHLTPQQLEAIITHELEHIRRNDFLGNCLLLLAETILFFNPFVRWMAADARRFREYNCDDFVLRFDFQRKDYAMALFNLEKFRAAGTSMALAATGQPGELLQRIHRILNIQSGTRSRKLKPAGILAVGLVFISLVFSSGPAAPEKDLVSLPAGRIRNYSRPELVSTGRPNLPLQPVRSKPPAAIRAIPVQQIKPASAPALPDPAYLVAANLEDLDATGQDEPANAPVQLTEIRLPEQVEEKIGKDLLTEIPDKKAVLISQTRNALNRNDWNAFRENAIDDAHASELENLRNSLDRDLDSLNWPRLEQEIRRLMAEQLQLAEMNKINAVELPKLDLNQAFDIAVKLELGRLQLLRSKKEMEEFRKKLQAEYAQKIRKFHSEVLKAIQENKSRRKVVVFEP